MLELLTNLFVSNTEANTLVQRHSVLKEEFNSIYKLLETEWAHKKLNILERADIVKKGANSYSISIDTYEDDDFWKLISDLKSCKKFLYVIYDTPPSLRMIDYNRLTPNNKEFAKQNMRLDDLYTNNKYINKFYFTFYY